MTWGGTTNWWGGKSEISGRWEGCTPPTTPPLGETLRGGVRPKKFKGILVFLVLKYLIDDWPSHHRLRPLHNVLISDLFLPMKIQRDIDYTNMIIIIIMSNK